MKVLSRREYDVRFFNIPGKMKSGELETRIEKEIRHNFPGNHGRYLHFSRPMGNDNYITAIVRKDIIKEHLGDSLSIPALLLPKIIKKSGGDIPGKLILWAEDTGEEFIFDSRGKAVSSRLLTKKDPASDAFWITISSTGNTRTGGSPENYRLPKEKLLFKKPLSPAGGLITRGKKYSLPAPGTILPMLIIVALLSLLLCLNSWNTARRDFILQLKNEVEKKQNLVLEIEALKEEISLLESETASMIKFPGPYPLLYGIRRAGEDFISITRLSFENRSFSLDALGPDPMGFTAGLSDTENFSEIDILKIRRHEDGFSFSMKGRFHE